MSDTTNTQAAQPTFAEAGLQELAEVEATLPPKPEPTPVVAAGNDGVPSDVKLQNVGFEPIEIWYRFKEGKQPQPSDRILAIGSTIFGTYQGSFQGGKFERMTHKVKLTAGPDAGKLAGLPSSGQLDSLFEQVVEGALVKVIYRGQSAIKAGQYKGSLAHNFSLAASELKPKATT